jgi:outer membrane protein assembly factor BamB
LNRSGMRRWLTGLLVLTALLLGVSGCVGGSVRPMSWTGLTVVGENLYAADLQQVQVLNASDSTPVWSFPADPKDDGRGVFYVTPAVDEGLVVVASQMPPKGFLSQAENVVWALDRETGRDLWDFRRAAGQYVEGGALGGGLFVIGNSDGNVYALDAESGALRWVFETSHRVWATPLIVSDSVYIGSMDRHFYALNLADGEVLWDFASTGAFAGTPALRGDTLYIGAFDDLLYALDANTGAERWRFASENWFWGSPVVDGDVVYAVDVNGNVYAIDAESGAQIWHQALGEQVRAGPALSEDGSRLFVGSEGGKLDALDTADGFVVWSRESEGQVLSKPVVSGSTVYEAVVFGQERIRALHVDNGRDIWTYPVVEEE